MVSCVLCEVMEAAQHEHQGAVPVSGCIGSCQNTDNTNLIEASDKAKVLM